MCSDRVLKGFLVMSSAVLCAGAMAWLGASLAGAAEPVPPPNAAGLPQLSAQALTQGPAPLPLRWRVPYVRQTDLTSGAVSVFCGTAVMVMNTAPDSVVVQVEWFDQRTATALGYTQGSVPSNKTWTWWSDVSPALEPFNQDGFVSGTGRMYGTAMIHADDPRILATVHLICKDSVGPSPHPLLTAMTNLPAFPVGATMEYFQAGMPVNWMPPMAVPELPETSR